MNSLNRDLTVLSRAVAYPNLSSAALHVGLSQPQLSRIVARLESDLSITLLDRQARRKSGWTPLAQKLGESCVRFARDFQEDLHRLASSAERRQLHLGTLEGLAGLATLLARRLFQKAALETIEISVLDLNPLEEQFLAGGLDLMLSFREPGRRKFGKSRVVGYQGFESALPKGAEKDVVDVLSPYELRLRAGGRERGRVAEHPTRTLVSNSLALRRDWIVAHGGRGIIPSEVRRQKRDKDNAIHLVAQEGLSSKIWDIARGTELL